MSPVSRWRSPKCAASLFPSVPLPEAAGPSIAMIMRVLMPCSGNWLKPM
jgi:hypothetical protein